MLIFMQGILDAMPVTIHASRLYNFANILLLHYVVYVVLSLVTFCAYMLMFSEVCAVSKRQPILFAIKYILCWHQNFQRYTN
jgi:hypothetical protein